jgi:bacterial/archaeal transporter family-2 protein
MYYLINYIRLNNHQKIDTIMMKLSSQLLLLLPLAMGIGIALTFQTAINTQLREYVYSPLQAALFSFLIGTIVLTFLVFIQRAGVPNFNNILAMPWYLWIGGCLGVYAITISIFTAPKLGLLTLSGLIIFGQIVTSMVFDQFGLLGVDKTPINWQRFLGGVVIFIGVLLTLQR